MIAREIARKTTILNGRLWLWWLTIRFTLAVVTFGIFKGATKVVAVRHAVFHKTYPHQRSSHEETNGNGPKSRNGTSKQSKLDVCVRWKPLR